MNAVKKIVGKISILLAFVVVFISCSRNASVSFKSNNNPRQTAFFEYFDTVSYLYSYAGDSEEKFNENAEVVSRILDHYNKLFDIYNEYDGINNLCTVNKNAGSEPVKVDSELIDFLVYANKACNLTNGEMNITMGSVLSLWHEARISQEHNIPDIEFLKEAYRHTGFDKLEIDANNLTVRLTDSQSSLDVGAIGKGYATEKAAKYLENLGLSSYVLNIGGNIRIIGTKADGGGWITGVKNPQDPDGSFAIRIKISDCSCVTSGTYERYFTVNGKNYNHIIDKDTLYPAEYFDSLTVICHDSGLADSLSTALFCMPFEDGKKLVDSLSGVECIWIFKDGNVKYTEGVENIVVDS